jgi:multidrug transporter EmrE-like cation transporter
MKRASSLLLFFLALYFTVAPRYIGDTLRWADDAVSLAQGRPTQFWEFGHLLWRPWAYAGYRAVGGLYGRWFGDTPMQATVRFLIQTNLVFSCAALLLTLSLLRRVVSPWVAGAVALAMTCTAPFLDYSHSGAPYIPALLFSTLSLCLLAAAAERLKGGQRYALLAGVSFAVSCALWFPFIFSGLGVALAVYLWPPRGSGAERGDRAFRHRLAGVFLLALAGSAFGLFAAGAAAKGIGGVEQFVRWVQDSGNGLSQSRTAMRAVSGVARSVWDFGQDSILLKRWLLSDPYNPVDVQAIVFGIGWKLGIFYLGFGAAIWALWKERREVLFMLAAAGIPVLLFAVFVFEPSAPERFLPVFPFIYLGFAAALKCWPRRRVAAACLAAFLCSFTVYNLAQFRAVGGPRFAVTRERVKALSGRVQPGSLVFVATFEDDLYRIPALRPLDRSLAHPGFVVTDTVEVASQRVARWRSEFAERTIAQWSRQNETWLSERVLAPRPAANWLWVEGDSGRIHWREFRETFGQFDFDAQVMEGQDGFVRLARNDANSKRLASLIASAPRAQ